MGTQPSAMHLSFPGAARTVLAGSFRATLCSEASAAAAKPTWHQQSPGALYSGINSLVRQRRSPGVKRLNTLLMGVQSQRDVDKLAVPALQLYKRAKIPTTQETASLYVKACCKAGDSEKIVGAFTRGEKELGLVTPGAKTLKYAMVALEREGDGAGVMKLFRRAKQPDRDVYLIAARSCLSQGMDKEAKVLEQRAQEQGVSLPNELAENLAAIDLTAEPEEESVEAEPAQEEEEKSA